MSLRVRFAPSPTGTLHVGGARTALFNWLLARSQCGVFVLRIEDTDRTRSSDENTQVILDALEWLGLEVDEGPSRQSEGIDRHRADGARLVQTGAAYRDFSTDAEIEAERDVRERGDRAPWRRRALAISPEESVARAEAGDPFAVRLHVPAGTTAWDDIVHGRMAFDNADIDDFVVLRRDGTPTYNLAVVSDDADSRITHVVRGDDHLSNTPKQILIYEALGLTAPRFGHVPMILGPDGKRLSKRHGATGVGEYRDQGILPGAMVNFLALLGWSPGDDREFMTTAELIDSFSMDRVLKKSAIFDLQKLEWLNGRHLVAVPLSELEPRVIHTLEAERGVAIDDDARTRLRHVLPLLVERSRTMRDLTAQASGYVVERVTFDPAAEAKHWKDRERTAAELTELRSRLADSDWTPADLEDKIRGLAAERGTGAGKVIHPLRIALLGTSASPGIFDVLVGLGRETALARIDRAVEHLSAAE